MDSTGGSNAGMQMDGDGALSFPSSSVMVSSTSDGALTISKASSAAHPHHFFSAGWDSLVQLDHRGNLVSRSEPLGSNCHPAGNQVIRGSTSLFPSHSVTDSRMAYFGSRNLSEAGVGSLSMPEFIGIPDSQCLPGFSSYKNDSGGNEMNSGEGLRTHECWNSEDGLGVNSPTNGRTMKRSPDSRSSYDPNEVGKKQKHERDEYPSIPKQNTRQSKDHMSGEEASKETYIHVRARRGQATNSHSLAERIRREKISERMKMLQELVPGCSKITGKAVMLDEIINYVQSLQQQVEFLSMKISTLIPDLSFDAGKPLLMDMNSHHAGATAMGLGNPGLGSFQHFPPGMSKGTLPISPSAAQCLSLSQLPFDSELHALYQMGFDSNSTDILKPEGMIRQMSPWTLSEFSHIERSFNTGHLKPEV